MDFSVSIDSSLLSFYDWILSLRDSSKFFIASSTCLFLRKASPNFTCKRRGGCLSELRKYVNYVVETVCVGGFKDRIVGTFFELHEIFEDLKGGFKFCDGDVYLVFRIVDHT